MARKHHLRRPSSSAEASLGRGRRRSVIGFDWLENRVLLSVTSNLNGQGTLDISLSATGDAATISTAGQNVIVSDGTNAVAYPGTQVLAINAQGALSSGFEGQSVSFDGTVAAPQGITVSEVESITVSAGATLSTRDIPFGQDPGSAVSLGNSTALSLSATTIDVASDARLLAQGNSSDSAGDITLAAQDLITMTYLPGIPNFQSRQTDASIQVGNGTTIKGANVSIDASASTAKLVTLGSTDESETTQAVVLADVNGDGKPDLIEANDGQPVRLYLNNGTNQPFSGSPISIGSTVSPGNATSLAVADVNGDGKPDLVVGYDGAPPMLFLNDGSSTAFASSVGTAIGSTGHDTSAVALADLNGDNKPDLVVGNVDAPDQIYLNSGQGNFNIASPITLPESIGGTTALAVGNVYGGALPDLVVGQDSASGLPTLIYKNLGGGNFALPTELGTAVVDTTSLALADLNGDGRLDVVQGNDDSPSEVYVASGTSGNFPEASAVALGSTADVRSVTVGDVDGDSRPDIVLGINGGSSLVYLNDGQSPNPFQGVSGVPVATDESSTAALALGDVTGGGKLDLIDGTNGDVNRVYPNQSASGEVVFGDPELFTPEDPELTYTTPLLSTAALDLSGISLFATAVLSSAQTQIQVGSAIINATGTVSILANSLSNAEISTDAKMVGVSYGSSVADATVDVASGGSIVAGGDFDLEATTNNTLSVSTRVPGIGDVGQLTLSYGYARSNSSATIEPGATVSALNATINASNTNMFDTATSNQNFQSSGNGGAGATLSIGDYGSEALATVSGHLTTLANASITATSNNIQDDTTASATNTSKIQDIGFLQKVGGAVGGKVPAITTKLGDVSQSKTGSKISDTINLTQGAPQFSFEAGMAFETDSNDASASVEPGGKVVSGANLAINADAEDTIRANASAGAGDASTLSIGGAILIADLSNTSEAFIGQAATVDAAGTLAINAEAHQPNAVDYLNLKAYIPDPYDPSTEDPSNIVSNYTDGFEVGDVINPIVGLLESIFATGSAVKSDLANTFTGATGSGKGQDSVGIAGSLNVLYQTNSAKASIDPFARVNQDYTTLPANQNVSVTSDAQVESIDPNGQASVVSALGKAAAGVLGTEEGVGAGGSLFVGIFNDSSTASIGDGALVKAGQDVTVAATSFNFVVAAAQAGSQSSEASFQASVSYIGLTEQTVADIASSAVINAGRDLSVTANSETDDINFTGGLLTGANIGVGISSTLGDLEDSTAAYIGNPGEVTGSGGSVTVGRNLNVEADGEQNVVSIAVAGASAVGGSAKTQPSTTGGATDGEAVPSSIASEEDGRTFGIDVSGEVAFNLVNPTTLAYIQGPGTVNVGGSAAISATSNNVLIATGGGLVIAKNIGLGGDAVENLLFPTTLAYTTNVNLRVTGGLSVTADSDDSAASVAVGGTGAQGLLALTGSADFSAIGNDTEADLGPNTTANVGAAVSIEATNRIILPAAAGAASVAAGLGQDGPGLGIGVGAAIVLSLVANTVLADVDGTSTLNAGGDVEVLATSREYLTTVAAALGAGGVDGIGADGSIDGLSLNQDVEAYLGNGGIIKTPASVYIGAYDHLGLMTIAGGGAGGETVGVGISAAIPILDRTVQAYVGSGAVVDALGQDAGIANPEGSPIGGKGLTVDAEVTDDIALAAVSGAISTDLSAQASVVADIDTNVTNAFIGSNAGINADGNAGAGSGQSVRVNASHDTNLLSVAGGVSAVADLAGTGLGAAIETDTDNRTVQAYIDTNANVEAVDDILVTVGSVVANLGFVAGISAAGELALQGSILDNNLFGTVAASINNDATVTAQGNVEVAANSQGTYSEEAGQLALTADESVAVSLAASIVVNVISLTTTATIGSNASVSALGQGETIEVPTGQVDSSGNELTAPLVGLAVIATGDESVTGVSLGGAVTANVGGDSDLAGAGSAAANVLTLQTTAAIGFYATINTANHNQGATTGQDVDVLAANHVLAATAGGAATASILISDPEEDPEAIGAAVGAGVAATEDQVGTLAEIDPYATVLSNGSVQVQAIATETAIAVAAAASLGLGLDAPDGSIAGTAAVRVLQALTLAEIGSSATVTAQGNVLVSAMNQTETVLGAGDFGAGETGLTGSIGVVVISPTTTSTIGQDANVNALGLRGAMTVNDGDFVTSDAPYDPDDQSPDNFLPPSLGSVLPSGLNPADYLDAALVSRQTETPETTTLAGLAVTAIGQNVVETAAIGGSLGIAALALAGSLKVVDGQTNASIGQGAQINSQDAGASPTQGVLVAAGNDYFDLSVTGTGTVASGLAVGPAVDLSIVSLGTSATIGQSALVNANGDIAVVADALEDNISLAAAGALVTSIGGTGAIAGSFGVLYLDNTTLAEIDPNAQVIAGGNVAISADDDTTADSLAGALTLSLGKGSFGASAVADTIVKDTEAVIGSGAKVTGSGQSGDSIPVYSGSIDSGGDFTTTTAVGVAVQAGSSETLFTLTASGSAGLISLAGATSIEIVEAKTLADIGSNAVINGSTTNANPSQAVVVAAVDHTKVTAIDGSLGVGIALAGGVDADIDRNQTSATIDGGATVNARGNIDVFALSQKGILSYVISAAAGLVGIGGAADVQVIGGVLDSPIYDDPNDNSHTTAGSVLNANDGSSNSLTSFLDGQIAGSSSSPIATILADLLGYDPNQDQQVAAIASDAESSASQSLDSESGDLTSQANQTDAPVGTTAIIGSNAIINAGSSVNVSAQEGLSLQMIVGGVALAAGLGFGGSAGVVIVGDPVEAEIDDDATVNALTGSVNVSANLVSDDISATSFAGAIGGLVGLGAQALVLIDHSAEIASIGNQVTIGQAPGGVEIGATAYRNLDAESVGVQASLGIAAGAAFADVEAGGTTEATVGNDAQFGLGTRIGLLSIDAESDDSTSSHSIAVSAGVLAAAQGSVAIADVDPTVESTIGDFPTILSVGDIVLTAQETAATTANAVGVAASGRFALGASVADSEVTPTLATTIGQGGEIFALGNIELNAVTDGSGAQADSTSSTGGLLVGSTGSSSTAVNSPRFTESLGGSTYETNRSQSLSEIALDNASADARGYAGGIVGVGVSLASATTNPRFSQSVLTGAMVNASAFAMTTASTDSAIATTQAIAGGLVGATGTEASATVKPSINESVGDASIHVSGSITIEAIESATGSSDAAGIAVGLLAGVGVSEASTAVSPWIDVVTAAGDVFSAGGSFTLLAVDNENGQSSYATASSSSGGIAGYGGSNATLSDDPDVEAHLGANTSLQAGSIVIQSNTDDYGTAEALGDTYGILGFGNSNALAISNATNVADVGAGSTLSTPGNLTVSAETDPGVSSEAIAGSGGIIAGVGATSESDAFATTTADLGQEVTAKVGGSLAITGTSMQSFTSTLNRPSTQAFAIGTTIGGITVGESQASTTTNSLLNVSIGTQDHVTSGTFDLSAVAGESLFPSTSYTSSPTADAVGSNGSLFGDQGTDASSTVVNTVQALVGADSTINTGNINIKTESDTLATPYASNTNDGIITIGEATGTANIGNDNLAEIAGNVTINATGNFNLSASSNNFAYNQAYGHGDSLVNDSQADTTTEVYYSTNATIGAHDLVMAAGSLFDQANTNNSAINDDSNSAGAFAADPGANSLLIVAGQYVLPSDLDHNFNQTYEGDAALTEASVGTDSTVQGDTVTVQAFTGEVNPPISVVSPIGGNSDASADGFALNPNSYSGVSHVTESHVDIAQGAVLDGTSSVSLATAQPNLADYDFANSTGNGFAGDTTAAGDLGQITFTIVDVETGSVIMTPSLYVDSATPTSDFNHDIDIYGVSINTGEDHDNWRGSSYNNINFNATVNLPASPEILEIGPSGNVIQDQGITFSQFGQILDVADIDGGTIGSVTFNIEIPYVTGPRDSNLGVNSPGYSPEQAILEGSPHFVFTTTLSGVTISNASNNYILINNITTTASGIPGINYEGALQGIQNPFANDVSESSGPTPVSITQTGVGDVDLAGQIVTQEGSITVIDTQGNIEATKATTSLDGSTINLDASGNVDSSVSPIGVLLFQEDGSTLTVNGQAGGSLELSLQDQGITNQAAAIDLPSLTAGSDIDLQRVGATSASSTLILLDQATAGGTITIDDTSSGGTSASLEVSGIVSTPGDVSINLPRGSVEVDQGGSIKSDMLSVQAYDGVSLISAISELLVFANTGEILDNNTGNLTIGQPGDDFAGLIAGSGSATVVTDGNLVLDSPVLGYGVTLFAISITEATPSAYVSSPTLAINVFGGPIGSADVPFGFTSFEATPILVQTETFDSTNSTNQYLAVVGGQTGPGALISGILEDDLGLIELNGGSFDDEGLIKAATIALISGTLSGQGSLNGTLQATGGTLDPGDTIGQINLTGNALLQSGSTFQVHLTIPSGTMTPVSNRLQGTGIINLNGISLAVTLANYTPKPRDQFTIIQSSGMIVGTFNQGSQIVVNGQTFQIIYGTNTVVLRLDTAPAVVDIEVEFGSKEYSILNFGRDLPWADITAIDIFFNESITAPANAISLTGINVATYKPTVVVSGNEIRLSFPSALGVDHLMLSLAGASPISGIQDIYGTPMASSFTKSIDILPGDFNGDGVVGAADMTAVNNATVQPYYFLADLNGDGKVDINDVKIARAAIGTKLPPH